MFFFAEAGISFYNFCPEPGSVLLTVAVLYSHRTNKISKRDKPKVDFKALSTAFRSDKAPMLLSISANRTVADYQPLSQSQSGFRQKGLL